MNFLSKSIFNIFIVFEHISINFFTSNKLLKNHICVYLPPSYILKINYLLKNELFLSLSQLTDLSAIDLNFQNQEWVNSFFKKIPSQILIFYIYSLFIIKTKLTIFTFFLPICKSAKLLSIESLYLNSNWLEREVSEMFGVYFFNKKDTRTLLLEYSSQENPMLKSFPCEGFSEIYYNFFINSVETIKTEVVEL